MIYLTSEMTVDSWIPLNLTDTYKKKVLWCSKVMLRDVFYGSCMRSFGISNLELLLSNVFVKRTLHSYWHGVIQVLILPPPSPWVWFCKASLYHPKQGTIRGKSLKISIYLHFLIPPKWIPCKWCLIVVRCVFFPGLLGFHIGCCFLRQLQEGSSFRSHGLSGNQIHPVFSTVYGAKNLWTIGAKRIYLCIYIYIYCRHVYIYIYIVDMLIYIYIDRYIS